MKDLGTYRYKRMQFGLRNAPPTLQIALEMILYGVRRHKLLVYLEDVIVLGPRTWCQIVDVETFSILLAEL